MLRNSENSRARGFCFTANNYTEELFLLLLNYTLASYVCIGKEVGDSGTPHLQGYFRFVNCVRFSTLKKAFPTVHFEVARGTAEQNITYCSKEGDFHERGDRPNTDGRMTGWIDMMRQLMFEINHGYNSTDKFKHYTANIELVALDMLEFCDDINPDSDVFNDAMNDDIIESPIAYESDEDDTQMVDIMSQIPLCPPAPKKRKRFSLNL